jgi:hypothetical protein
MPSSSRLTWVPGPCAFKSRGIAVDAYTGGSGRENESQQIGPMAMASQMSETSDSLERK